MAKIEKYAHESGNTSSIVCVCVAVVVFSSLLCLIDFVCFGARTHLFVFVHSFARYDVNVKVVWNT